jgi:DtxR family Mn-dependent transcriptional regulator
MIPHPNPESSGLRGQPLSTIEVGQRARVNGITTRIRGAERRRLMDLGIVAGTQITAEMRSPGGDPTAYRVRGAVIALRENQAREIKVTHELDQE